VTDRGKPVARLVGIEASVCAKTEDDIIAQLQVAGLLEVGERKQRTAPTPVKLSKQHDIAALVKAQRR
jgi:antitoxin (DNA-binding transcriptional repressor) of toxin-antitoxin stability system